MSITRTVDVVEIVWTVVALTGLTFAVLALRDVCADRKWVRSQDGDRRPLELELVNGDVTSARWIIAQELLQVVVGALALATEQAPGGRTPLTWALIVLLIAAAAVLPIRLHDQRRRRRRLGLSVDRRRS